jgi:hypothetical protein
MRKPFPANELENGPKEGMAKDVKPYDVYV